MHVCVKRPVNVVLRSDDGRFAIAQAQFRREKSADLEANAAPTANR